jgi:segregation and condensation protein A
MEFSVKLPLFEGPFDLLLFFIQRDELDIHDIPISRITQDFLEYLKQLEEMNIEVASEFILVAATLMSIKAKILLPRPVLDAAGNEIDPREELVSHLLEYKRYKSVLAELEKLEAERMNKEKRGNISSELAELMQASDAEAEVQHLDLYKLLKVYLKVIERYEIEQTKPVHRIVPFPYTIEEQKKWILAQCFSEEWIAFETIILQSMDKIVLIFNFLAILELLQMNRLQLRLGEGMNNFWLRKQETESV